MTDDLPTLDVFRRDWVKVRDALDVAINAVGADNAHAAILGRLKNGQYRAVAERHSVRKGVEPDQIGGLIDVPGYVFNPDAFRPGDLFWTLGDLNDYYRYTLDKTLVIYTGIRLPKEDVQDLLPTNKVVIVDRPDAPLPASRPVGGNPGKTYWEDMIIAVAGDMLAGDFDPKSQSEVVKAMSDWAVINGHDPADSSVKVRARKLWAAYKRG